MDEGRFKFRPNYQVKELHVHPFYELRNVFTQMYDLGMIKLNQSISAYTEKSICLPELNKAFDPNLNEYGMFAGWGGSKTEGLRLGYTRLKYLQDEEGENKFILSRKLGDIRICSVSCFLLFPRIFYHS